MSLYARDYPCSLEVGLVDYLDFSLGSVSESECIAGTTNSKLNINKTTTYGNNVNIINNNPNDKVVVSTSNVSPEDLAESPCLTDSVYLGNTGLSEIPLVNSIEVASQLQNELPDIRICSECASCDHNYAARSGIRFDNIDLAALLDEYRERIGKSVSSSPGFIALYSSVKAGTHILLDLHSCDNSVNGTNQVSYRSQNNTSATHGKMMQSIGPSSSRTSLLSVYREPLESLSGAVDAFALTLYLPRAGPSYSDVLAFVTIANGANGTHCLVLGHWATTLDCVLRYSLTLNTGFSVSSEPFGLQQIHSSRCHFCSCLRIAIVSKAGHAYVVDIASQLDTSAYCMNCLSALDNTSNKKGCNISNKRMSSLLQSTSCLSFCSTLSDVFQSTFVGRMAGVISLQSSSLDFCSSESCQPGYCVETETGSQWFTGQNGASVDPEVLAETINPYELALPAYPLRNDVRSLIASITPTEIETIAVNHDYLILAVSSTGLQFLNDNSLLSDGNKLSGDNSSGNDDDEIWDDDEDDDNGQPDDPYGNSNGTADNINNTTNCVANILENATKKVMQSADNCPLDRTYDNLLHGVKMPCVASKLDANRHKENYCGCSRKSARSHIVIFKLDEYTPNLTQFSNEVTTSSVPNESQQVAARPCKAVKVINCRHKITSLSFDGSHSGLKIDRTHETGLVVVQRKQEGGTLFARYFISYTDYYSKPQMTRASLLIKVRPDITVYNPSSFCPEQYEGLNIAASADAGSIAAPCNHAYYQTRSIAFVKSLEKPTTMAIAQKAAQKAALRAMRFISNSTAQIPQQQQQDLDAAGCLDDTAIGAEGSTVSQISTVTSQASTINDSTSTIPTQQLQQQSINVDDKFLCAVVNSKVVSALPYSFYIRTVLDDQVSQSNIDIYPKAFSKRRQRVVIGDSSQDGDYFVFSTPNRQALVIYKDMREELIIDLKDEKTPIFDNKKQCTKVGYIRSIAFLPETFKIIFTTTTGMFIMPYGFVRQRFAIVQEPKCIMVRPTPKYLFKNFSPMLDETRILRNTTKTAVLLVQTTHADMDIPDDQQIVSNIKMIQQIKYSRCFITCVSSAGNLTVYCSKTFKDDGSQINAFQVQTSKKCHEIFLILYTVTTGENNEAVLKPFKHLKITEMK